MALTIIGLVGLLVLLGLLLVGVPIAFALAFTGVIGLLVVEGLSPTLAYMALIPWDHGRSFVLVTVPLFVLMGQLVFHTGMATDLYKGLRTWIGRVPGGLAIASVMACGGFGAVTGSSIATVATMGSVVMPEIRRYDYDMRLAAGALAASGTLGILIPPSLIFIFYGVMTETSIGALFIAGIVPGVLTLLMFSGIILVRCVVNPKLGPKGPRASWRERFRAIGLFAPVFALFALAIGGIYAGIFTPTEAAGVGCVGVMITALVQRKLTWSRISAALHSTALISVMIFAIILGGYSVARFLAVTGLTEDAVALLVRLDLSEGMFLFVLVIVYLVLGSMLDVFGMLVLTIPILLPIVTSYGFDRVWFGVFVTIMAELALVTPPIGANVFVMRRVAPDVPMGDIFLGVLPFVVGELVLVALLVVFPQIALWLPGMMN